MERKNIREAIKEAEQAPTQFQPKERAKYVRDMIALVEEYQKQHMSVDEIKQRMPDFVRDYENLFNMVTKPGGYDKQQLKTMLVMLDQMGSGNLSQHQASVIIGKKLADNYIKPVINE